MKRPELTWRQIVAPAAMVALLGVTASACARDTGRNAEVVVAAPRGAETGEPVCTDMTMTKIDKRHVKFLPVLNRPFIDPGSVETTITIVQPGKHILAFSSEWGDGSDDQAGQVQSGVGFMLDIRTRTNSVVRMEMTAVGAKVDCPATDLSQIIAVKYQQEGWNE